MYLELYGPITFAVRFAQAAIIVGFGLTVLCIGFGCLQAIGRTSLQRRRHGRYVLGWMVFGSIAAGLVGVMYLDGIRYYPFEADVGAAGFGLLAGWLVGMIHGGLVLWLFPARMADGSEQVDTQ